MIISELTEKMHLVADHLERYATEIDEDYAEEFLIALDMFIIENGITNDKAQRH